MEDSFVPLQRLSYAEKSKSNFKWVDEVMDYYDFYHGGNDIDLKRKQEKYKLNYDLAVGRCNMTDAYRDIVSVHLDKEKIDIGLNNVHHYPIVNQIVKGMWGQWSKRPLEPVVYDASGAAITEKKRIHAELIQNYLQQELINPKIELITQQYFSEYGIQDVYQLSPEDQQQIQADLDKRIQAGIADIKEYMDKGYRSPSSIQAQKLTNYLMRELRIKEKTDNNFEHLLCTGEAYFYTGIRHNRPVFEQVNPMWFTWSGSQNNEFCEDGEFCKYVEHTKVPEFFNRYGDILKASDINKIPELISFGTSSSQLLQSGEFKGNVILELDYQYGGAENFPADFKTRRGQSEIASLYTQVANKMGIPVKQLERASIRETHITFRSMRKLKSIKRIVSGKIQKFYRDEHYEFDPLKGDFEEKTIWVNEIWQGRKAGGKDGLYFDKGRLPFQYKSLSNPFDVKHPYVGQKLDTLSGNTENVALVDLGKVWNIDYDIAQARLKEKLATDVGKVFLMVQDLIPEGYTFSEWFKAVKYTKIAPIQFKEIAGAAGNVSPQILKDIDLSQVMEFDKTLNHLQYLQNQTAISMYYNPSMLGQISPYITSQNNQTNISASSNQTEKIFATYGKIIERSLNNLLKAARIAYKNHDEPLRWVLDDGAVAELELDSEMLDRSEMGLFITNDYADIQAVEYLKQNILALMQNQYPMTAIIKILASKSSSEVLSIVEAEQKKMEAAAQEKYQQDMAMQKQNNDMQKQLEDMRTQVKMIMQDKELANKKELVTIDSHKFMIAQDVDKDGVNDANERKDKELEQQRQMHLDKINADSVNADKQIALKEKELDLREREIALREKELKLSDEATHRELDISEKEIKAQKAQQSAAKK